MEFSRAYTTLRSALALLAVAGCSQGPGEFAEAERMVKLQLRDPESAQFADLRTYPDGTVCGTVNSRNGFGGYAGAVPFFHTPASETKGARIMIAPEPGLDHYVRQVCDRAAGAPQ